MIDKVASLRTALLRVRRAGTSPLAEDSFGLSLLDQLAEDGLRIAAGRLR